MAVLKLAIFIAFWLFFFGPSNSIPIATVNINGCEVQEDTQLSLFCYKHEHSSNIIETILTTDHVSCSTHNFSRHSIESIAFIGCNYTDYPVHLLQRFQNIKKVYLPSNQIASLNGSTFGSTSIVEYLDLSSNQITSINGTTMDHLKNLRSLLLAQNRISSVSTNIFDGLSQLARLDLQYNFIDSIPDEAFALLPNLYALSLAHNSIQTICGSIFSKRNNMNILDLSYNQLTVLNSTAFLHLEQLKFLNMSHSQLIFISSDAFSPLVTLAILDLSNNWLMEIDFLVKFDRLRQLYINNNRLTELSGHFMDALPNNTVLTIDGNPFENTQLRQGKIVKVMEPSPANGINIPTSNIENVKKIVDSVQELADNREQEIESERRWRIIRRIFVILVLAGITICKYCGYFEEELPITRQITA